MPNAQCEEAIKGILPSSIFGPFDAIDFGLFDFVKPDKRLNDIVGSAYYVAPEVLHRAYSTELL
ncbi:Cdpk-related protein kinase, partial [Thalictrum thalictroides]